MGDPSAAGGAPRVTTDSALAMGAIFNLGRAAVMIVDDNSFSLRLTAQMLMGFGVKSRYLCASASEAQALLRDNLIDLLIVDCDMPEMDGYDLVSWLRRSGGELNCYTPVLMMSGHTRKSMVAKARDCGANFFLARPVTPATMLERILWIARDPRPIIQSDGYVGPDRRFNDPVLPEGMEERRADMLRAARMREAAEAKLEGAGIEGSGLEGSGNEGTGNGEAA